MVKNRNSPHEMNHSSPRCSSSPCPAVSPRPSVTLCPSVSPCLVVLLCSSASPLCFASPFGLALSFGLASPFGHALSFGLASPFATLCPSAAPRCSSSSSSSPCLVLLPRLAVRHASPRCSSSLAVLLRLVLLFRLALPNEVVELLPPTREFGGKCSLSYPRVGGRVFFLPPASSGG